MQQKRRELSLNPKLSLRFEYLSLPTKVLRMAYFGTSTPDDEHIQIISFRIPASCSKTKWRNLGLVLRTNKRKKLFSLPKNGDAFEKRVLISLLLRGLITVGPIARKKKEKNTISWWFQFPILLFCRTGGNCLRHFQSLENWRFPGNG